MVTFYVQVEDIQAALDRVEELDGSVIMRRMEVEGAGVTIALFADPEGNAIGLIEG